MCGRFTLTDISTDQIRDLFLIDEIPQLRPRYNIAPTQGVAAVRVNRDTGNRELAILTWGLVPSWAKDPSIGSRMINARAESVHEKPAYRTALRYKRCLVLADGFYEWAQMAGRKQPMYIRREDHGLLAFAGLWEYWASPGRLGDRVLHPSSPRGRQPVYGPLSPQDACDPGRQCPRDLA